MRLSVSPGSHSRRVWSALCTPWHTRRVRRSQAGISSTVALTPCYLGKVIQFNAADARAHERYAYVASEILHLPGETDDQLVAALVQEIRSMNDELNIPQGIKNYGKAGVIAETSIIDYEEFETKKSEVAANALLDACTGSNPRIPAQQEMEQLLECVYLDKDVDF